MFVIIMLLYVLILVLRFPQSIKVSQLTSGIIESLAIYVGSRSVIPFIQQAIFICVADLLQWNLYKSNPNHNSSDMTLVACPPVTVICNIYSLT